MAGHRDSLKRLSIRFIKKLLDKLGYFTLMSQPIKVGSGSVFKLFSCFFFELCWLAGIGKLST